MVIFLTCISLPDRLHEDGRIIDLDVFFLPIPLTHFSSQVPIYTEYVKKLYIKHAPKTLHFLASLKSTKTTTLYLEKNQYILKSNL